MLDDTSVGVVNTALSEPFEQGVEMGEGNGIAFAGSLESDGVCQVRFTGTRWRKVAIKIKRWREAYAVGRVFYATFQELQVLRP